MTGKSQNGKPVRTIVREIVEKYDGSRDELIPILSEINQTIGYLPKDALQEMSDLLKTPKSQLYSVTTFYRMLSTKPMGKHVIQFCQSAPCHVVGGREVWNTLREFLHLEPGETSLDGKWTLITTNCLGACGVGPVIVVDEDIFGRVTPQQVEDILARYE
jgi:NADH-quinone oxidoreductase subunit E